MNGMGRWGKQFFDNWQKQRRVDVAKEKMDRVVDHLLYVLRIQANNDHLPSLSKQIGSRPSYAHNAFNVFAVSSYQIEAVRFCALWDAVSADRENIPTVAAMVDDEEIIEALAQTMREQYDRPSASDPSSTKSDRELLTALDKQRSIDETTRLEMTFLAPLLRLTPSSPRQN